MNCDVVFEDWLPFYTLLIIYFWIFFVDDILLFVSRFKEMIISFFLKISSACVRTHDVMLMLTTTHHHNKFLLPLFFFSFFLVTIHLSRSLSRWIWMKITTILNSICGVDDIGEKRVGMKDSESFFLCINFVNFSQVWFASERQLRLRMRNYISLGELRLVRRLREVVDDMRGGLGDELSAFLPLFSSRKFFTFMEWMTNRCQRSCQYLHFHCIVSDDASSHPHSFINAFIL